MGIGFFFMTILNISTPISVFLIIGFGAGLFQSLNNSLVMFSASKDQTWNSRECKCTSGKYWNECG